MSDLTPLLQEVAKRTDATEMLTPHEIRRAGERRRMRLVVATATCVALSTVVAGLLFRGVTRDAETIEPAGQPNPTTRTNPDGRVGIVGPPPAGTPPTGPATGKLVAVAGLYNSGTWVYADGRIINVVRGNTGDQFRGYVVRQLTPSGVEAMRSFLLDGTPALSRSDDTGGSLRVRDGGRLMFARDFNGCEANSQSGSCPAFEHPETWLPANAWADPTFRPFIPHAYMVCVTSSAEPAADVAPAEVMPAAAADLFMASPDSPLAEGNSPPGQTCRVVANPVARELADIIDAAGPAYDRRDGSAGLAYQAANGAGGVMFEPVLPHGEVVCSQCG